MTKRDAGASRKIASLVALQIAIILASFLILQHFESEKTFLGNTINVAGKDRYLTANVLVKLHEYNSGAGSAEEVIYELEKYGHNMNLLRNGGVEGDLKLQPLEPKFHPQWEVIHSLYSEYDVKIRQFLDLENADRQTLDDISHIADNLVTHNDALTSDLGLQVQLLSSNLIWYQIIFAAINIGAHLVLIWVIFRILRKDAEYWTKMERLYTIGEMAARLTHDLRNPLTVIKNAVSLLLLKPNDFDESLLSRMRIIDRATQRMSHQIDGVMDFVRTRQPQLREHSVRDILQSSMQTTEVPETTRIIMPENDAALRCDRRQIEVLFSNLLSNAIQAIGDKEGLVRIRIDQDLQEVTVEFEDSGPGIPDDVMPKIFEPLFTTKQHGTGLGLVSCKNIVDAHKGRIAVRNNPTRFIVTIPKIID